MIVLCDDADLPQLASAMAQERTGPVLLDVAGRGWRVEFLEDQPMPLVGRLLDSEVLRPWRG